MPPPTEKEIQDEAERAAAEERARLEEERKKQEEEQEEEEEDEVSDLNQMRVVELRGDVTELVDFLCQGVEYGVYKTKHNDPYSSPLDRY